MKHTRTVTLLGLAVAAALVVAPGQAFAQSNHVRKPTVAHFVADGLIVGSTNGSLRILASHLHVGKANVANRVITVARASSKGRHQAAQTPPPVGYHVLVSGNAVTVNNTTTYAATGPENTQPRRAGVFLGTLTSLNGTLAQINAVHATDGHDDGQDTQVLSVDTSAATLTVDGTSGTLGVGQFLVVLGERSQDTVVAASVYAFSTAPSVVSGEITAVSGTSVTLDGDTPTVVDLAPGGTAVPILLNGTSTVTPDALTTDMKILILGQTSSGVFTPTQAFAFDGQDTGPCGHNEG